mmetsp:Transcript_97304/g.280069  ORF Transcript_97304/g.280069 Transcript_97304/m.280069 type:complete len:212 (+) Transcript_97304:108-743(+)
MLLGFSACCCRDLQDKEQVTFTDFSTTDEAGVVRVAHDDGGVLPYTASDPARASPQLKSPTEEETQAERVRLQDLVNKFAKRAIKGCPCSYIREGTGDRLFTQYRVDRRLENVIIVGPKRRASIEVTCPIADIQDVYSFHEDGEDVFPSEVLKSLRPPEKELLLMVIYKCGEKLYRFCLLEESKESRDSFLECLRILCIYAQSAPTSDGAK